MTATRDPAARRFREFGSAVRALARDGTRDWPATFKENYIEIVNALVENYLVSIPSLRHVMKPPTFVAGARVIACEYLRHVNIAFAATVEMGRGEVKKPDMKAVSIIEHTICPGDHAWIGAHCSKCFTMRYMTAKEGGNCSCRSVPGR